MKPGLDRRHGPAKALRERLATRATIIGEQHDRALLLIQRLQTVDQRRKPFGSFARGKRVRLARVLRWPPHPGPQWRHPKKGRGGGPNVRAGGARAKKGGT